MYAVVEVSGFQYKVEQDQVLQVPRMEVAEGDTLTLDRVLLVKDGDSVRVGAPTVEGAAVSAEVVSHGRGPKINAGRFMRRKDYRRRWGHRQDFTEIKIASIQA